MGRRQPPRSLKLVVEHFKPLKDPRIDRTKLHPLENILVMTLSASICDAEGWAGEVVAIDGKTLRGAVEKAGKKTQLHMVHVWATTQNLLLAQKAVEGGASGEMAAIPKLLEVLDLEGAIITTDANSCTAAVTRAIVESGADYVLAVKGNRGRFHDHVVNAFAERERFAADRKHTEIDEGHGRKETRVVSVLEPADWPWKTKNNGEWAGLRTAARIERTRARPGSSASA